MACGQFSGYRDVRRLQGNTMGDNVDSKQTKGLHSKQIEIIAAIAIGILAIAAFGVQAFFLSEKTTPLETVLFNCLEFLLTLGFTWFSTRAISRSEFENNLKRFAISAYRRISDIEIMTKKLQHEVHSMISECPIDEVHNLKLIGAIASDTAQVIRSSISDWADVIGDELITIEKIKRLEHDKEELTIKDSDYDAYGVGELKSGVSMINQQIEKLTSSLPALLQIDSINRPTRIRENEHAAEWLTRSHKNQGGLRITCVTGDDYAHDRDFKTLKLGEELHTVKGENGAFDIADKEGAILGRLQNNSPLGYFEFVSAMELCYGTDSIMLEVIRLSEEEKRGKTIYGWFEVKVVSAPKFEKRKPKSSRPSPKK